MSTKTLVTRLISLDALKGFCMVIMALDHANYFIAHKDPISEFWAGPTPLYENFLQFITRIISHPAAPGFFFLMGTGVTLFSISRLKNGWSQWQVAKHFVIRGAILIAVQLLIENRLWELRPTGENWNCYFGVLYGLGFSMIVSGLLNMLPTILLTIFSLGSIIGSEIILKYFIVTNENLSLLTRLLVAPGTSAGLGLGPVDVYYPLFPWIGVAGMGIVFGRHLNLKKSFLIGIGLLASFFIIRFLDGLGNIRSTDTFFTIIKYPPSLAFLCFTLGIDFIILGFFSSSKIVTSKLTDVFSVFGKAPLFFYIAHLILFGLLSFPFGSVGTSLAMIYPFWILVILALYPACLWYGDFKAGKTVNSIWRLF